MVKRNYLFSIVFYGLIWISLTGLCLGDTAAMLEQAEQQVEDGKYDQAEAIYKAILAAETGTDDALAAQEKLSVLYVEWNKQTEAETSYQRLISDFSGHSGLAEAIDHVADAYRFRTMRNYTKAKQLYQYIATSWPTAEYAVEAQGAVVRCSIQLGDV